MSSHIDIQTEKFSINVKRVDSSLLGFSSFGGVAKTNAYFAKLISQNKPGLCVMIITNKPCSQLFKNYIDKAYPSVIIQKIKEVL